MSKKETKSFIIIFGLLLCTILQVEAQTVNKPTWVSIDFGHNQYRGDLGSEMFGFDDFGYDWTIGLSLDRYLNNYLDLELSANYGELDYENFFNTTFINSQAILQYKPFKSRSAFDPFVGTGLGITNYWDKKSSIDYSFSSHIPLQAGFDVSLSENTSLTTKATYNRTFTNNIDGTDFSDTKHDDFMIFSLGIKISLSRSKDSDGDGVMNENDLCPNTAGSSFWGCPDSDQDGVVDNEDSCPNIKGDPLLNGCPDSDGDGVDDKNDNCPDERGIFKLQGCPDKSDSTETVSREITDELTTKLEEFSKNITFTSGSTSLDSTAQSSLDQLVEIMSNDEALQLIIRSYTDNSGSASRNLELSVARATSVKQYLAEQGIAESRLYAFGYGQANPIATNATREGRARNRRIELNLYYN